MPPISWNITGPQQMLLQVVRATESENPSGKRQSTNRVVWGLGVKGESGLLAGLRLKAERGWDGECCVLSVFFPLWICDIYPLVH